MRILIIILLILHSCGNHNYVDNREDCPLEIWKLVLSNNQMDPEYKELYFYSDSVQIFHETVPPLWRKYSKSKDKLIIESDVYKLIFDPLIEQVKVIDENGNDYVFLQINMNKVKLSSFLYNAMIYKLKSGNEDRSMDEEIFSKED